MARPRTCLLQGEPGSGKSMMACLTAIHKPVHVIDIDRKVGSAGWAQVALDNKQLTYWELTEPVDDSNIKSRIASLVKNEKPPAQPQGWTKFAEYIHSIGSKEEAQAAGTWVIDSLTLLNEHLKTHIMYLANRSKYGWDQWNALKVGWLDTLSVMRDVAKEHGKDLILMVHERPGEMPGDRSTGVKYEQNTDGSRTRVIMGTQDLKIWASIDGATGQLIGAEMDEYYHLYVAMEENKPVWKCRVHPDGRRNLRTSFKVSQSEFEPDFRKIWK